MLDQYEGKSAVEFIRSHAYRIMDITSGDNHFVKPQTWSSVQGGMTLELSFAVRQTSPTCVWCGAVATVSEPNWINW